MTTEELVYGLRVYVLVVTILVAIVGTCQVRRWFSFLPENQLVWLAVVVFNFAAFYGTADQLAKHVPGGIRSYITAIAVTFALYAVCYWPTHVLVRWLRARRLIKRATRAARDGQ